MFTGDGTLARIPMPLIALLVAGVCVMALIAMYNSKEPPVEVPIPPPVVPAAKPITRLNLLVTGCSKVFGYTQISGHVENTGDVPVRYVSVTTVWRDADNRRVDYGTIFVVGDKDLKPGETASFQDGSRHSEAKKCGAKLEDWWSHNRE